MDQVQYRVQRWAKADFFRQLCSDRFQETQELLTKRFNFPNGLNSGIFKTLVSILHNTFTGGTSHLQTS